MTILLKDDVNTVQYTVMINGKEVFSSSIKALAEGHINALCEGDKASAMIVPKVSGGKQFLCD